MKVTKKQLQNLIKEEVIKQKKIIELEERKTKLQENLRKLNECDIEEMDDMEEGLKDVFKSAEQKALAFVNNLIAQATKAGKKVGYQWITNLIRNKFKIKSGDIPRILHQVSGPLYKTPDADEEFSIRQYMKNKGQGTIFEPKVAESVKKIEEQEIINVPVQKEEQKDKESIFDAKPGETVIFNFNGTTIKVQRQLDDLFKVVDATESHKLKNGDYLRAQGNDILEPGRTFRFAILREVPITYETRPLETWKIIRN